MQQKTIVILQPGYLPWLGFFEQLDRADIFVLYDTVQYDHSWRNRNRIKTAYPTDGHNWQWLTVPVKAHGLPLIKDVQIAGDKWPKHHLGMIESNYRKTEFFSDYFPALSSLLLHAQFNLLADLDNALIRLLAGWLDIDQGKIVLASQLDLKMPEGKTEKNIAICKYFGVEQFYEASAGRNYIDEKKFIEAGIKLTYQDYQHPTYRQLHGDFVPYLSAIDLLFNEGHRSLEIIRQGGKK